MIPHKLVGMFCGGLARFVLLFLFWDYWFVECGGNILIFCGDAGHSLLILIKYSVGISDRIESDV